MMKHWLIALALGCTALSGVSAQEKEIPATCAKAVSDLGRSFETYLKAAWNDPDPGRQGKALTEIREIIQASLGTDCESPVSLHYLRTAFLRSTENGFIDDSGAQDQLLDLLIREDRIQVLTPEIREEMGGEWAEIEEKGPSYRPTIMAAYDCQTGMVWFDPLLPPFNLAGAFAHEMDHLVRDKLIYPEGWKQLTSGIAPDVVNVLDEVLANFFGAVTQFRVFFDSMVFNDSQGKMKINEELDLSLFSRGGVVTGLVETPERREMWRLIGTRGMLTEFGLLLFLYEKPNRYVAPSERRHWGTHVAGLVNEAYYPNSSLSIEDLKQGLSTWFQGVPGDAGSQGFEKIEARIRDIYPLSRFTDRSEKESEEDLLRLQSHLDEPSPACLAFVDMVDDGNRPSKDKTRPSKGGVRLSKGGVRPSKDTLKKKKPRPGRGVRACRWPDRRM